MTTKIEDLKAKRANVFNTMTAIMDRAEDGQLKPEDATAYDAAEADFDRMEADIARLEAYEAANGRLAVVDRTGVVAPDGSGGAGEPIKGDEEAYAKAFKTWATFGMAALNGADQQLLRSNFEQPKNAQGVGTGGAGGYLVPPAFRAKIIETMTFIAVMRQMAEVISTETGATLPWPTADDTANEGAILGENTQATEQDVTIGQADIGAYMYTSKIVRVSFQLLQDAGFNFEGWLGTKLGQRIGRIQNRHFTVGTGTSQPDGIVTSAQVGRQGTATGSGGGGPTGVTYDELVDLTESLDPAYLEGGNLAFMMSQAARKVIRKLKDTQGRPLWEPSLQAGIPDSFMGYRTRLNNYVPVPAASAKSILFGDFREAYLIRDVMGFRLIRLDERYADYGQVGFIGFQRSDGTMQNTSAVKAYQQSAT